VSLTPEPLGLTTMARTSPGDPRSTTLAARVKTWVSSTGFELEMNVAREFQRNGLVVAQSQQLSTDDKEGAVEVDVMAWKANPSIPAILLRCYVLVECKKAHFPWVLFTKEEPFDQADSIGFRETTSDWGSEFLRLVSGREDLRAIPSLTLPQRVGYGLRTATFSSSKPQTKAQGDRTKPWHKAEDAQIQLRRVVRAWWSQNQLGDAGELKDILIYFPTVVLDGRLFEARLEGDAGIQVEEIKRGVLELALTSEPRGLVLVDVVTNEYLPQFARDLSKAFQILTEKTKSEQEELVRAMRDAARPS